MILMAVKSKAKGSEIAKDFFELILEDWLVWVNLM